MRPLFGATAVGERTAKAAPALPTVPPLLDPASIADHAGYWALIAQERNLPDYLKEGLPT